MLNKIIDDRELCELDVNVIISKLSRICGEKAKPTTYKGLLRY